MGSRPAEILDATAAVERGVQPTVPALTPIVCLGPGLARATPVSSSTGAVPGTGQRPFIDASVDIVSAVGAAGPQIHA